MSPRLGSGLGATLRETDAIACAPKATSAAQAQESASRYPHLYDLASFFSKIELTEEGCWPWRATRKSDNYGVFYGTSAHRTAYRWFVGVIPDGYQIDHLCRHPWCVNPAHLEAVSRRVNMQRAAPFTLTGLCKRGHRMTPENIGQMKRGDGFVRVCRACRRLSDLRRPKRNR